MRIPFVVAIIAITGSCGVAAGVSLIDAPVVGSALPSLVVEDAPPVLVLDDAPITALVATAVPSTSDVREAALRALSFEPQRADRLPRVSLLPAGEFMIDADSLDNEPLVRSLAQGGALLARAPEGAPLPRAPLALQLSRFEDAGPSTYFAGKRTSAPDNAPAPAPVVFTPFAASSQGDARAYWAAGVFAAAGAAAILGFALYHRIRPNAALENETRKTIFDAVCAAPGLGVHEVSTLAQVSYSTATYHLERLVGAGMIVMTPDGNKLCYYKNGGAFTESERRILPLIKNEEAAKLFEAILHSPGTYRAALAEQLGVTATTINWHLRRLREAGLVDETRAGRSAHLYAKIDALRPVFLTLAGKVETTEPTIAVKLRTYAGDAMSPSGAVGAA